MTSKFGNTKSSRSFITNKYKARFKQHMALVLWRSGTFDSKLFGRYIDAVMKMEKNMLINEMNRGEFNINKKQG